MGWFGLERIFDSIVGCDWVVVLWGVERGYLDRMSFGDREGEGWLDGCDGDILCVYYWVMMVYILGEMNEIVNWWG